MYIHIGTTDCFAGNIIQKALHRTGSDNTFCIQKYNNLLEPHGHVGAGTNKAYPKPMLQLNCPTNIALLTESKPWDVHLVPPTPLPEYGPTLFPGLHRSSTIWATAAHA
jgi:hypothetical protein